MSSTAILSDLAPSGVMRAAINIGNPILAAQDAASGELYGVSVDLARELARRLGIPLELVCYSAAGKVVDAATTGEWDIAFVAVDPIRGANIIQTAPYVVIEGAYLVASDSTITCNEQVDREGHRVVVGKGSAYDLYLSRELKQATIVRAPTSPSVVETMIAQELEVAAGVRQQLESDARQRAGLRMLDGRFMVINQAMGTPKARGVTGGEYLLSFVEEMKAQGFVAAALERHAIRGAGVAPLAAGAV
ncbi:MAG: polar amino acid transport system substrate-binding protein [Caballeronia sp.]|jgi:polar amino acid transport system substrate-binding protein|nr:polar amino acid transport system substrate-binding protein [Caballeronia sp.]